MANFLGLNFKSKKEREKEYREYFKKIFPYGEPQKQKVQEILAKLISKREENQLMLYYVLIKEAMMDSDDKDYETITAKIEKRRVVKLTPELRDCIRLLIDKDLAMDESLAYPTVQELKAEAAKEH